MEWTPCTRHQLEKVLQDSVAQLTPEDRKLYESGAVSPFVQTCERFGLSEGVFVVARNDKRVVFFDDIEEEFGTNDLGDDGVLRPTGTYGGLGVAVRALFA